jgi:hypothetical protein
MEGPVVAPSDFCFFRTINNIYKEKYLRTKTHCKKQLCNISHPFTGTFKLVRTEQVSESQW